MACALALAGSAVVLPASVSSAAPATPVRTVELVAERSSYTSTARPTKNYDAAKQLKVSKSQFSTYLAFPQVTLRPGEKVKSAVLALNVKKATRATKGGIVATAVANDWTPTGLTSSTAPKAVGKSLNKAVRARTGHTAKLKLNASRVTSMVGSGVSLRLRYSVANASVYLERSANLAPKLLLTISGGAATESADAFSIAVIPDTQNEVLFGQDQRFVSRTTWLADQRNSLNLRYVVHTGDVTNWGWLAPSQFSKAKDALSRLSDAAIPYSLVIGNHDTAAVGWDGKPGTGYGGGAYMKNAECPSRVGAANCNSKILVRWTGAFNTAFPLSSVRNVGGAFEAGRVDNVWTTFSAGDTRWLVLTLELWPRKAVVDWARSVVSSHPGHNVIVATHHYLDAKGTISKSNGGYGANSPAYLYKQLISKYSNIKIVLSGHTGGFAHRTDSVGSGKVLSFLGNDAGQVEPVRILRIDPVTGSVTGRVEVLDKDYELDPSSGKITITR
jgi:hypothetical protein